MNVKLLFLCLFLAVLLIPAELKPGKRKKHRKHHDDHDVGKHGKHKKDRFKDIIEDQFFEITDQSDDEDEEDEPNEWLYRIQEPEGLCFPNPCHNDGVCEEKGKKKYKCHCSKPFKGRKCEKAPKVCRKGKCGRGECVLSSTPPFFECKCKLPFLPPDCKRFAVCQLNPCMNGGLCIPDGNNFECQCPRGFRGRFCHVGPDDCFVDDGESYRGNVSETIEGEECLYWNSHFILERGTDPFNSFEDKDGLGRHNFCRNPDGDSMPWCFFRKGRSLLWDYCDVDECSEPTEVAPTGGVPPTPGPTTQKPQPTKPEPTKPAPTQIATQAPQPSAAVTEAEQFSTCGVPQPKKAVTRIFGGLKVPPGEIPWQVSLQARPRGTSIPFRHLCGGVLIDSCWVLTAGHCIEKRKDMQVVMGSLSLDSEEPSEQAIGVEEVILHENYRETREAVYNDIALLKLKGTDGVCARETQFVKTACLPNAELPDGEECTISGWGATEDSRLGSNHLLEANVLLINQQRCSDRKVYGSVLDDSMFCAGYLQGGVDSCQGDSGGPLTCQQNNTHVIYGLVSWGDQCGRANKPGVYARVTHFLDWIKSKTQAAS